MIFTEISSEVSQWVMALDVKPEDRHPIPDMSVVKGDNKLPLVGLWHLHSCLNINALVYHQHTYTSLTKK